jgi:Uma2 family endonuclease
MAQATITERRETLAALPKMTYEEFLDWADEDTHAEWVDGDVIIMSPASSRHQRISSFLHCVIKIFVEVRGLGEILPDGIQMRVGPKRSGREPDLLFVAKENLSRIKEAYVDGPADLVVEIISPDSVERDRIAKYREYEQGGVREYWLIDPLRDEAEFYQADPNARYRLAALEPDGRYHSAVLEGFRLDPAWLWQMPLPPTLTVLKEHGVLEGA